MEKSTAKAMARQVRISPMKVRQVLALIRGKDAGEANEEIGRASCRERV